MSVKEELRGITPTYQAVLNSQLKKVADAFDSNDLLDCYVKLKVLIGLLRPVDRDPLLKNDLHDVQKLLVRAMRRRGADQYQTWLLQGDGVRDVLQQNLWTLFLKVMTVLHGGRYLAITTRPVETNVPPEFFGQATR